jgi:serine/threonine protein kinase
MADVRAQRITSLFAEALTLPADAREPWLARACTGDPELLRDLRALLAVNAETVASPTEGAADGTESSRPVSPGMRVGSYRLVEEIGRGGMGIVYKAWDERLERFVALKFLTALPGLLHERERVLLEARAASALDHPGVCTVFEVGEVAGRAFIAMAYYEGEVLAARLATGLMPIAACVDVILQAAAAIGCAHAAGIVHCDLKPSNILITSRGTVRILDFGIAQTRATHERLGLGTLTYAAPEQLTRTCVDARSDVWSLGVVFYELLAGVPPFNGKNPVETAEAVLRGAPAPVSAHRPSTAGLFDDVLRRTLARDPAERFESMAAFADAVRSAWNQLLQVEGASTHSLPTPLTSFVGRDSEVASAMAILDRARLLTITGSAGTGKTRFSIELARLIADRFRDGVRLVSLAPVSHADGVAIAIGDALGITLARRRRADRDTAAAGGARAESDRHEPSTAASRRRARISVGAAVHIVRRGRRARRVTRAGACGSTLRRARAQRQTAFHVDQREYCGGRRGLPQTGRRPAGHRAGGSADQGDVAERPGATARSSPGFTWRN